MEYIRYHPLIDCDSDGVEKVPMFFSADEDSVRENHSMYLVECIPHTFRLVATNAIQQKRLLPTKSTVPLVDRL